MTELATSEERAVAQCTYCLSEMPGAATVCAHCGRRRPMSKERRTQIAVIALASFVAVVVLGLTGWATVGYYQRQAAVERIVECAHLHGDKDVDAAFVNSEIDMGMEQTGKSWRAGAEYAALSLDKSGLIPLGTCFITQQTLFSD